MSVGRPFIFFSVWASFLFLAEAALSGKIALINGTLVNPGTAQVRPNAVVVVDGNHISEVSNSVADIRGWKPSRLRGERGRPRDAEGGSVKGERIVDCKGKFILPGYIDTHVHFFQSGDIYTRPDAVDLTNIRSYKDEVGWTKRNLTDAFRRYIRSGITSVVDVGGPFWNFEVRRIAASTACAPRVAVAGPLISSVSRPQLDLGDPPIVKIETPEQGREMVGKLAAQHPDYVKIWYIVNAENPVEKFQPIVHAVVEESHSRHLRVAVHATELEAARTAVNEGADLLVHSVTDKLVDDSFVNLLKEKGTILCPTLVVFERYGRTFANKLNLTTEEQAWGNPEVIASLDATKIPEDKRPERIKTALADPNAVLDRIRKTYDIALKNLKTLEDAGVTIAAGTDAGNIGTIHGPALFREFQLMKEAGLTPMQILQCATSNAAKVFDTASASPKVGTISPGNLADLVILNGNPIEDITQASAIDSVVKDGILYPADSIIKK